MRFIHTLLAICMFFTAAAGDKPHEAMYFFNKSDRWCMNSITVSSDSVYFYAGSCENEVALAKGKWHMNGDTLVLANFDRKDAWPHTVVSSVADASDDSIHLNITDYFNAPYTNIPLTVFDSAGKENYCFADTNGNITLPKGAWTAFALNYKLHSASQGTDSVFYNFADYKTSISINIDYPNSAALDREAVTIDFEHLEFIVKDGMLYDETGKAIYDNKYLSDVPELKPISKPGKPIPNSVPAH